MGEEIVLRLGETDYIFDFNNYALQELAKVLKCSPIECNDKIMEMGQDDQLMTITVIIYAGIVGYQKRIFNINHGITPQLVSEWMAHTELEQFEPVWQSFIRVTGMAEFLEKMNVADKKKIKTTSQKKK